LKTGFLIIARLKSTRLPEKLLREVYGRPILAFMIDRLKLAKRVDRIIVCTSTNPQDDRLVDLAVSQGVAYYRGNEDDVVKRLHDAAVAFDIDYILSITGDCPFVDPVYADKMVDAFESTNADLILASDLPHGAFSWGIKPSALKKVLEIKNAEDTEVWGRYFTDTDLFHVYNLPIENVFHRQPELRMTLDYQEDLEFFKAVYKHLYQPGKVFSLDDILNLLKEHPEIIEINCHCAEAYKKRWTKQSDIKLKPRYSVSKVAVIGCGSIGQRHIRNLRSLGITDIIAFRTLKGYFNDLPPELEVKETADWDQLFAEKPDVAIVSNPSNLHLETMNSLIPRIKGIFIEKPLSNSLEGVELLLNRIKQHRTISFVGYNLQFDKAILAIQDILNSEEMGRPLVFQCQVGHWLPDWHPYEDYRDSFAARRDLGGGVSLTLIHEIHLAQELLGPVEKVQAIFPEYKQLQLDVDVIADLMLCHTSGAVSQIHLDYVQRPLQRCGTISCEHGWIRYDLVSGQVMAQSANETNPRVVWNGSTCDPNQQYIDEIATFVRYTREGRVRHPHDAWKAARSLAIVDTAFIAAASGRMSKLPAWIQGLD
jgi:spore coat polysaccharide biosynthesis protein SpsF